MTGPALVIAQVNGATFKPASTAPLATDTALVVALSPNSAQPPSAQLPGALVGGLLAVGVGASALPAGAATEASLAPVTHRFSPSVGEPVTITTTAPAALYTPALGKRARIKWIGLSSPETNTGGTLATVRLGGIDRYRWYMGGVGSPGAFSHGVVLEGAVDAVLEVVLDDNQTVYANVDAEDFEP